MAAKEFIASVTKVLVTRARPERVYLIGSFARGQEDCDSDIDLLVVKDTDLPRHKRARELRKMIAPYKYPLDLLVYSRDEFEKEKTSPALLPTRPSERGSSSAVPHIRFPYGPLRDITGPILTRSPYHPGKKTCAVGRLSGSTRSAHQHIGITHISITTVSLPGTVFPKPHARRARRLQVRTAEPSLSSGGACTRITEPRTANHR